MPESKKLYVQGVEVTQAIQYYRSDLHLHDSKDRGPDNSLWLTAQKSAWVRVYVRSGSPDTIHNVTGKLRVERYPSNTLIAELTPQYPDTINAFPEPDSNSTPFVAADAFYKMERKDITRTLNFIIPRGYMCGNLRLIAKVQTADGLSHEKMVLVNATHRQRIWLRGVMIGYDGDPNKKVDPPEMTDLEATSYWTMLVYPIASAVYVKAGTFMLSQPLHTNGCVQGDPGWSELMLKLSDAADADGNLPGAIYYGLIAQDVPGGGGCGGFDSSGLYGYASGFSITPDLTRHKYAEIVMAHEIGHALHGKKHVEGCVPPQDSAPNDPNYPAYEPYNWPDAPGASIGEYGLNINRGQVLSPEDFRDLMSYCPKDTSWMSIYGHKRASFHAWLHPEPVCPPQMISTEITRYHDPKLRIPDPTNVWRVEELKPIISIFGVLNANEEFTIGYVRRTESFGRSQGTRTAYMAILEDSDGQVLAHSFMYRLESGAMSEVPYDCGCGERQGESPPYFLKTMLSDVAPGAALVIMKDGEEIWRRNAPAKPPKIVRVSAEINKRNRLVMKWHGESRLADEMAYWLQWSANGGASWQSLATGVTSTEADLSLEGIPEGEVQLRVIAHDGFFSIASESVEVIVPAQPPIITILHPREGDVLTAGRTLRLWAVGTSFGEEIESHDLLWLVDGREAGRGLEVWTVAPDEGEHTCTLRLEGRRQHFQQTVNFRTTFMPL